jgi:ribose transport system ATP-binding protein
LLRAVYGEQESTCTTMQLHGNDVSIRNPRGARRLGIGYVPEDRQKHAMFATLSVRENHVAASLRSFWRGGRMQVKHEHADARGFVHALSIKTAGTHAPIRTLSGGNQQKVVLSRWLRREPSLMLLDEPSQGVDVSSRADLYAAIRAAVDQGLAAIVVASDFEELVHVCDRVVVLRDGRVTHEFSPPPAADDLISATFGTYEESASS